jgi:hypothetical protein
MEVCRHLQAPAALVPQKLSPLLFEYKVGCARFKEEETLLLPLEIRKMIPWVFAS